jgi:site-specific recombinase XerD
LAEIGILEHEKEATAMTTKRAKNIKLWPPIHEITYTSGKTAWQVACQIRGVRIRETFDTRAKAETRAAQIRAQVQREGAAAFNLPPDVRAVAAKCHEKLAEHGASIEDAVRHYLETVVKFRNAPTVAEVVDKLIADTKAAGRREKTVTDLRYRLGKFARIFGKRKLSEITLDELQEWSNDPTLTARSRRHLLTKVSQLFRYAEKRGWCEKNIAAFVARPDVPDGEPSFLRVEQCARLLECAPDHDLLPYIVLSLFCGIRCHELRRLTWEKVKLAEGVILIDGSVAKTKSRRIIELSEAALAWLATCSKPSGHVVDPVNFRKRLDALRKAAGLVKDWPKNALRHTAATYLYALTQDAVRVSAMLGNSPDVLHRHYRGLTTKAEAERFFALRPAADAEHKIVAIAGPG